jgi:hypothetical protein
MTIVAAWTRKLPETQELIVASDSRLSGGGHVDVCQKIFPLSRGDSFIAFCGDTLVAFPLMFQLQSAIANFQKSADRTEDVTQLVHRILLLLNSFVRSWKNFDTIDMATTTNSTRFLFGGWSWRKSRFMIYPIQYSKKAREFRTFTHSKQLKRLGAEKGSLCYAIGDYLPEFRHALREKLKTKERKQLDYEPLDIIGDMLSEEKYTVKHFDASFFDSKETSGLIGGAPQAIKIYPHANTRVIAARWPRDAHQRYIAMFGRPLFDWEMTFDPIYDFQNQQFTYPLKSVTN